MKNLKKTNIKLAKINDKCKMMIVTLCREITFQRPKILACEEIFFLSENFCSKMQKMDLEIPQFAEI